MVSSVVGQQESTAASQQLDRAMRLVQAENLRSGSASQSASGLKDQTLHANLMIVDDEPYNIMVVQKFLQHAGYQRFATTTDSTKAISLMQQNPPDVVLLDIMMPEVSGLDLLRIMKATPHLATIPVIVLTASADASVKTEALQLGANDFLSKPVEPGELVLRVRNVLTLKLHFDMVANYSINLERQVQERTRELAESRRQVIYCLARAAEFRDNDTGRHVIRVGKYAGVIARELGYTEAQVEALEMAAQLHDVGKIGIPDAILHKPGKLDPEEFDFMQKHTGFGKQIIECMATDEWSRLKEHTKIGSKLLDPKASPVMSMACRIALTHHEWWNGAGYPLGLAGEDIPVEGRITAVADVFDALSSKRPYKKPIPREQCFQMLEEKRGQHFDPTVLDAFFRRAGEITEIQIRYADEA